MQRTILLVSLALALVVLAGGCSEDSKHGLAPPEGPDYLPLDSTDNLVDNLVTALTARDYDGYAALLYDGVLLASDDTAYSEYHFDFDRSEDPTLPEFFDLAGELACIHNVCEGLPGQSADGTPVPGIESISLLLSPSNAWQEVLGAEVDGYACPDGTVWRSFSTDAIFTLKSAIGGSDVTAWIVQDRATLYCIPVSDGDEDAWRLWRWRDVISLRVESTSLGQVKALYIPREERGPKR